MTNQTCCIKKQGVFNKKCYNQIVFPGCWRYCTEKKGKCNNDKIMTWYSRRCGTGYDTISYKGPGGHPKANGFAGVLFTKKAPGWLWDNSAFAREKGPICCPNRTKGHKRAKTCFNNKTVTPSSNSIGKSVIPAFHSYEDVLAVRKTMAFYDPKNFKKSRSFKRSCTCKI
jgi:hypothetical protein